MELWPNFFIIGAPKAGTTSLYQYLKKIPGIYISQKKEPNYFSVKTIPDKEPFKPIRDTVSYLELFNQVKDEKIIGESSTNYLYDPEAAKLIHQKVPNAYILASLRDPVERAWSHYLMIEQTRSKNYRFGEQVKKELRHEIDFNKPHLRLKAGLYCNDVKKYLELFGKNQVKIIIFEEWIKDVKNTVNEIIRFLGLDYIVNDNLQDIYYRYVEPRGSISKAIIRNPNIRKIFTSLFSHSNNEVLRRFLVKKNTKPKMNEEDREKLVKFYQDDVRELEKLLGRKLHWSNF